jgi:LacI family transcriptional regulator
LSSQKEKITINDIARLAGVSKKTVSRVINNSPKVREQTRQQVQAIIEQNGYRPHPQARALALRRSFLVAMIYDNPSPQYIVNMQRAILDELEDTGLQLIIRPCDRNDEDFYQRMQDFVDHTKISGAILPPSVSEDQRLIDLLTASGCRCIRIASVVLDEPENTIKTHDSAGAAQAARHLAELGHRNIAHIRGPLHFRSSHERLRGFREVLKEYGVELGPDSVLEAGYTFATGFERATELLARGNRPTAIFAGNDEMAIGVYQAAHNADIDIPGDLSVVGFDDTPIASRVWPPLTTVRLPIREMGRAAASLLLMDTSASKMRHYISFTPEIIVRGSTAQPREA